MAFVLLEVESEFVLELTGLTCGEEDGTEPVAEPVEPGHQAGSARPRTRAIARETWSNAETSASSRFRPEAVMV